MDLDFIYNVYILELWEYDLPKSWKMIMYSICLGAIYEKEVSERKTANTHNSLCQLVQLVHGFYSWDVGVAQRQPRLERALTGIPEVKAQDAC